MYCSVVNSVGVFVCVCEQDQAEVVFHFCDSTMKTEKFMTQLNFSYKLGGLTCSFNDYQLAEFIQQRRRSAGTHTVKTAVGHVGPQVELGCWDCLLSLTSLVPSSTLMSQNKWPGIAHQSSACLVNLPLSIDPLHQLCA